LSEWNGTENLEVGDCVHPHPVQEVAGDVRVDVQDQNETLQSTK
jgi:hypothetical protein